MADPVWLAVDIVLAALIGPPGNAADTVIERAEAGEWNPVIVELALFCAISSLRPDDRVDHARFARLLRIAHVQPHVGREDGQAFSPPSSAEIEHWRNVALGEDSA